LSRPFKIEPLNGGRRLRVTSAEGMNRFTHSCMLASTETVRKLQAEISH
jgi:hypothetical protein